MTTFRRWLLDESGQDLVEYVLLGATVALAGLLVMNVFSGVMNFVYTSWVTAVESLWEPAAPTT